VGLAEEAGITRICFARLQSNGSLQELFDHHERGSNTFSQSCIRVKQQGQGFDPWPDPTRPQIPDPMTRWPVTRRPGSISDTDPKQKITKHELKMNQWTSLSIRKGSSWEPAVYYGGKDLWKREVLSLQWKGVGVTDAESEKILIFVCLLDMCQMLLD